MLSKPEKRGKNGEIINRGARISEMNTSRPTRTENPRKNAEEEPPDILDPMRSLGDGGLPPAVPQIWYCAGAGAVHS